MWGNLARVMQQSSLKGSYECSLDNRFRLAIPSKHRHEFERGITVSRWLDECLVIAPREYWPVLIEKYFGNLDVRIDRDRWLRRYLMAGAYEQDGLDKQGRVVIPPELRGRLQLGSKAKLIGAGEYFELWNPELIDDTFAEMEEGGVSNYGNDPVGSHG